MTDLKDKTEIRTGFTDMKLTKEYPIMLKRMYAEVKRQVLMREGREETPSGEEK